MKTKEEFLAELSRCVLEMEEDEVIDVAKAYAEAGHDPLDGILDGLVDGMKKASDLYEREEYFIPERSRSPDTNVPLFTGLQLSNQYSLAKLNLQAAIEDLNKAKEDIAINVTSAYLQVLFNLELNKVAQNQVELSKDQLKRIKGLHDVGKGFTGGGS